MEPIYPMSPICRHVCLYLCTCVHIIYDVVCGSSKCCTFLPRSQQKGDGIWLEVNRTWSLSLYYQLVGQENEGETLLHGLPQAIGRETLNSAFSFLVEKLPHTIYRYKVENLFYQTSQTLLQSRWEGTLCVIYL